MHLEGGPPTPGNSTLFFVLPHKLPASLRFP